MNSNFDLKDYLCSAVIGHVDHGKTTFTAALSKLVAQKYPELGNIARDINKIDNAREEIERGITIVATHIPFFLPGRDVSLTDCPGHKDYINNMLGGSRRSDVVILVVAASEGKAPQTEQHVQIVSGQGIKKVFVVYNKMDMPGTEELIELVESEIQELLESYEMEEIGNIKISATKALLDNDELLKLDPLLDMLAKSEIGSLDPKADFRLAIEGIYNPKGQGTIISGKVISGQAKKDDVLDIVGMGKAIKGTITKIESFKQEVPLAKSGMDVGIQMREVNKENVTRGMAIITKGKGFQKKNLKILCKIDENRKTPFKVGFEPQCYVNDLGISITCKILKIHGAEYVKGGDVVDLDIELFKPVMAFKGDRIILRESKLNVAFGSILEVS